MELKPIPKWPAYAATRDGRIWSFKLARFVALREAERGYLKCYIEGIPRDVHQLVAQAWLPNPDGFFNVRNKNGNKLDNRVENLEWDSRHQRLSELPTDVELRPIPGEDFYFATRDGRIFSQRIGKFLTPKIAATGYLTVLLCVKGRKSDKTVHRLVAAAWLPNPMRYRCVNHLNSDRTDPRVENLEWCTHAQNSAHAVAKGRLRRGANHPDAILTEEQVNYIRECGIHPKFLATELGVSETTIYDVRSLKSWKHL